jgi:uncharacterized membrane protein
MTGPRPPSTEGPVADRLRDPGRVEALTDGVFAIVLTILVLEVAVPPNLSQTSLRRVVEELRPTLIAWVISFLIVGMYWVGNRDLFARLRYANRDVVWLNLLSLLPVSLIPFGASVLGEYPDEPIAMHIYGIIVVAAGLMRLMVYWYLARRPWLMWEPLSKRGTRFGFLVMSFSMVVNLVAMAVADVSTTLSRAIFFAGPLLYFLLITILRERPGTRDEADDFS